MSSKPTHTAYVVIDAEGRQRQEGAMDRSRRHLVAQRRQRI